MVTRYSQRRVTISLAVRPRLTSEFFSSESSCAPAGLVDGECFAQALAARIGKIDAPFEHMRARRSTSDNDVAPHYTLASADDVTLLGLLSTGNGSLSHVSGHGSETSDPDLIACVVEEYKALKFAPPEGGIVTVVHPIRFSFE